MAEKVYKVVPIGLEVKGYCGGAFGSDSFSPKVVEAIGKDWIVARNDKGVACFASLVSCGFPDSIHEFVMEHRNES